MCPKNLFPKPSPLLAPLTSPAISVNSTIEGIVFSGLYIFFKLLSLSSGRVTIPEFGSIVQKG